MITTHRSDITAKEAAASSLVEEDAGINRNSGRREVVWNNLYVPEKEPEWDVDSFDGREYESDPEDREFFNDEDRYQKHRQSRIEALKNKGFLPDEAYGIYTFCNLQSQTAALASSRELVTDLASLCVKKYNEDKGMTLEVDSVVRATVSRGGRWKFYLTLMAREYHNGPLVEYQAKVMWYIGNSKPPFPIFCRPSPKL